MRSAIVICRNLKHWLEFAFKRTKILQTGSRCQKFATRVFQLHASVNHKASCSQTDVFLFAEYFTGADIKNRRARGRIPLYIIWLRYHWKQIRHVSISRIVISRYLEGIITRIRVWCHTLSHPRETSKEFPSSRRETRKIFRAAPN